MLNTNQIRKAKLTRVYPVFLSSISEHLKKNLFCGKENGCQRALYTKKK